MAREGRNMQQNKFQNSVVLIALTWLHIYLVMAQLAAAAAAVVVVKGYSTQHI